MFNKSRIIKILEKKGWSRYRLCKEAKMAQSTLSDILGGKNVSPKTDTLQRIADALGVSVNDFFDEARKEDDILFKKSSDNDLMRIERARNKMKPKDKEKMMKILEASFEDYFDDED